MCHVVEGLFNENRTRRQLSLITKLQSRFVPKQSYANNVHYFLKHGYDGLLKAC